MGNHQKYISKKRYFLHYKWWDLSSKLKFCEKGMYRSLRDFGPIVWNSLLPDKHKLSLCKTLDEFKISIRDWKPENCPCELCNPIIPGVGRIRSGMSKNSDYYYYWFLIWFVVVVYSYPVLFSFTMNFIDFLLGDLVLIKYFI